MQGWSKTTTYIAVVMIAAGFLLIVLGWNGAAGLDFVQGQIPYVISGGLAGIGLVFAGVALIVVQEVRRSTLKITDKIEEMAGVISRSSAVTNGNGHADAPIEALNDRQKRALQRAGLIEEND